MKCGGSGMLRGFMYSELNSELYFCRNAGAIGLSARVAGLLGWSECDWRFGYLRTCEWELGI